MLREYRKWYAQCEKEEYTDPGEAQGWLSAFAAILAKIVKDPDR